MSREADIEELREALEALLSDIHDHARAARKYSERAIEIVYDYVEGKAALEEFVDSVVMDRKAIRELNKIIEHTSAGDDD